MQLAIRQPESSIAWDSSRLWPKQSSSAGCALSSLCSLAACCVMWGVSACPGHVLGGCARLGVVEYGGLSKGRTASPGRRKQGPVCSALPTCSG